MGLIDLEGVELEGKIGQVGDYSVDAKEDGTVESKAQVAYEKQLLPFLKVKGSAGVSIDLDIVAGVTALAEKSGNGILKAGAAALAKAMGR